MKNFLLICLFVSAIATADDSGVKTKQIGDRLKVLESVLNRDVVHGSKEQKKSLALQPEIVRLYGQARKSNDVQLKALAAEVLQRFTEMAAGKNSNQRKSESLKPVQISVPPENDSCSNALPIGNGIFTGTTAEATLDGSSSCDWTDFVDVWYRYTAPASGPILFATSRSAEIVSIHTSCPGTEANEIACDDDFGNPFAPSVLMNVTQGTDYFVRIARFSIQSPFTLNIGAPGSISGTVTDALSGQPLISAEVRLYDEDGDGIETVETGSSGEYSFNNLPQGTYFAIAEPDDLIHLVELYNNLPCEFCDPQNGTPITVIAGTTTPNIDFSLDRGGIVSGFVVTSTGAIPIEGIDVIAYDSNGNSVNFTQTNSLGRYTLGQLPSGTYTILTRNFDDYIDELYDDIPCNGCDPVAGTPVPVAINQQTTGIDFALEKGGGLSGTITDASSGLPIAGARVNIEGEGVFESAFTDDLGRYAVTGLPDGNYFAQAESFHYISEVFDNFPCEDNNCEPESGTPIPVVAETDTPNIDFALDPGGIITGTITNAFGTPLEFQAVFVYRSNNNAVASDLTDGLGRYAVGGLSAGNYYVVASSNEYQSELYNDIPCPDEECDVTTGTPVPVTLNTTTPGIDFSLALLGSISGKIVEQEFGAPIPFSSVSVYTTGGNFAGSAETNILGEYSVNLLNPGDYFVRTSNSIFYIDEVFDDIPCTNSGCDLQSGTPVTVQLAADTSSIDFELVKGGEIRGTVRDINGNPADDVRVEVYDSTGDIVENYDTESDGTYLIQGLTGGNYFLKTDAFGDYGDELYDNIPCPDGNCDPLTGTPVAVTLNAITSGIDFELQSCAGLQINPATLPSGMINVPYSQIITVTGGVAPYIFQIGGGLPPGLQFDSSGTLSGTPLTAGSFDFTIRVTDSIGCMTDQDYTINIQGSVLFQDDFDDGELPDGWTLIKPAWTESEGALFGTPPKKKAIAVASPVFAGCQTCSVSTYLSTTGGIGNRVWVLGWYIDKNNTMELLMKEENDKWILKQRSGGAIVAKESAPMQILPNTDYTVVIAYNGTEFQVYVDDLNTPLITMTPTAPVPSGVPGFQVKGTTLRVESVMVQ